MRPNGTSRARTPSVAGRLAGDVRRALVACAFVLALCVLAVVIANRWQAPMSPAPRPQTASEVDLSTGAMLVVSPTGNLCRERTIDNSTWQIRDKGQVDCAEALAKSANSGADGRPSNSRVELIRKGFLGVK
jgi:hypothetical protein